MVLLLGIDGGREACVRPNAQVKLRARGYAAHINAGVRHVSFNL